MFEFLRKILDSTGNQPTEKPLGNGLSDAELNQFRALATRLRNLAPDALRFDRLKDNPEALEAARQRKLISAQRNLEVGRRVRGEGRFPFATAVLRNSLNNMLDGIGIDHPLSMELLVELRGLIQEHQSEASAIAEFQRQFASISEEVNHSLAAHYLWYAATRMQAGHSDAALMGFRSAFVEATGKNDKASAKEASLGVGVVCRDIGHLESAAEVFETLVADSDTSIDPVPRYTLLHELAAIQTRLNQPELARSNLAEAQLRCRKDLPNSHRTYMRILQTILYTETVAGNQALVKQFDEEIRSRMTPEDPIWVWSKCQEIERLIENPETVQEAVMLLNEVQTQAAKFLEYVSSEYATLMETWAQVARRFDRISAVRFALRRAIEIRQHISGLEAPETGQVLIQWTNLLMESAEIRQAVLLAEQVKETFRKTTGVKSSFFARAANAFGRACLELGALEKAEASFTEAENAYRESIGPESREFWINFSGIGSVLFRKHRFAEAEKRFRESLEGLKNTPPLKSFDRQFAAIKTALSGSLVAQAKYDAANEIIGPLSDELIKSSFETLLRAVLLNQQFCMQYEQDQFAEALLTIRRAEILLIARHPNRARILFNRSACEAALGRVSDAIQSASEAQQIFKEAMGQEHPDLIHVTEALAELEEGIGKNRMIRLTPLYSLIAA